MVRLVYVGETRALKTRAVPLQAVTTLVWAVLFGAVGLGYFVYGRRQRQAMPFVAGLGLMAFPYFVEGALATALIGLLLVAMPMFVKI